MAIKFAPGEKNSGFVFKSEIKGGTVPKEYVPGVVKGLEECMSNGALAGYPVVDLEATLYDGNSHDVDSSVLAFQIAARGAFRDAMKRGGCKLMEPIMRVEVLTPEDHMGDVIGDLNSRRGMVEGFTDRPGGMKNVTAQVRARSLCARGTLRWFGVGCGGRRARRGAGATIRDVQLRQQPALLDQGPRLVRHEARRLQAHAAQHPGGDHRGEQGRGEQLSGCLRASCRFCHVYARCWRRLRE